jgi:hypothetical protein
LTPSSAIPRSMKVTGEENDQSRSQGNREERDELVRKKKTPERAMEDLREATNMMNVKMNHPQTWDEMEESQQRRKEAKEKGNVRKKATPLEKVDSASAYDAEMPYQGETMKA